MQRGEILTVLITIGDQVVRLRRGVDELSDHLQDHERERLFLALKAVENIHSQLLLALPLPHEH